MNAVFPLAMTYAEFIEWMFNLERFGIKLGLDNVSEFLRRIGNPHLSFESVHVTGTNGKGSVCVFVSEILGRQSMKVGLYTSPHLVDFRERIMINGVEISEHDVLRIGEQLKKVMEQMAAEDPEKQLTFFEFTTGMAFKYFEEMGVDIVVAEVGMGGRLDATNVITPVVSAITRIGLEHTKYLGTTIQDIAREKAGIIKPNARVVTCERKKDALSVIATTCMRKNAILKAIGKDFDTDHVHQSTEGTSFNYSGRRNLKDLRIRLLGAYQAENAACAISISEELQDLGIPVSDVSIREGIESARWPGRMDIVSRDPLLLYDGSHNPDGVGVTVEVLKKLELVPLTYVVGCMDDKDVRGIVRALVPTAAKIVSTQVKNKRALSALALGKIVEEEYVGNLEIVEDPGEAIERALGSGNGKGVCVIGSLYLVGEAIQWLQKNGSKIAAHKI